MESQTIVQIITALFYIGILYYYSRVYARILKEERQVYNEVFEKALDSFSEEQRCFLQRHYVLQMCDWMHARKTNGSLLGLPYLIPNAVMTNKEPINVIRYLTDEEAEAVIEGIKVLRKDKRTALLCDHFSVTV